MAGPTVVMVEPVLAQRRYRQPKASGVDLTYLADDPVEQDPRR